MRVFCKSIAFLFFFFFTANAYSQPFDMESVDLKKKNTEILVYLHPVALLVGANSKMLLFYSTIEVPLSLYNAPIIKPSLWQGQELTRVGSDFGFRHYLAGRGEGLYLQPQAGAFYFSAKNWSWSRDLDKKNNDEYKRSSGTWFDGMLYLGNAYKFTYISIYSDTGIGYSCALGDCALIYDVNIGLGISF
jgi:hypothetical protein